MRQRTGKCISAGVDTCRRRGRIGVGQVSAWKPWHSFETTVSWEFPGSPAVRIPRFHCRGPGFHLWSGKWKPCGMAKKNKKPRVSCCCLLVSLSTRVRASSAKHLLQNANRFPMMPPNPGNFSSHLVTWSFRIFHRPPTTGFELCVLFSAPPQNLNKLVPLRSEWETAEGSDEA